MPGGYLSMQSGGGGLANCYAHHNPTGVQVGIMLLCTIKFAVSVYGWGDR